MGSWFGRLLLKFLVYFFTVHVGGSDRREYHGSTDGSAAQEKGLEGKFLRCGSGGRHIAAQVNPNTPGVWEVDSARPPSDIIVGSY